LQRADPPVHVLVRGADALEEIPCVHDQVRLVLPGDVEDLGEDLLVVLHARGVVGGPAKVPVGDVE